MAASAGIAQADFDRLSDILHAVPGITFICLDVANGYSQHFVDFVRKVRIAFPSHTIIVSMQVFTYWMGRASQGLVYYYNFSIFNFFVESGY